MVGKLKMWCDILFVVWLGEELGLFGVSYFVKNYGYEIWFYFFIVVIGYDMLDMVYDGNDFIYLLVVVCFNMDMVGCLKKNLVFQGVGFLSIWLVEIEYCNVFIGLLILV